MPKLLNSRRQYSLLDTLIEEFDAGLRTLSGNYASRRPEPSANITEEANLSDSEKKHIASLMRINHSGEICAQALYQGQALTAKNPQVQAKLKEAAREESDHLEWCATRLEELDSHQSYLNPLWYTGSFVLGSIAGIAGDKWSLGFLAETEKQVVKHLDSHLKEVPQQDKKTRAILRQMKDDEQKHATTAINAGGTLFPLPLRKLMQKTAQIMTKTTYYL